MSEPNAPAPTGSQDPKFKQASPADRNLLFGILALQMDFISREALIAATQAWLLDKNRALGEILVEQRHLQAKHRDLLEPLVAAHLKQHGGDPEESLASLHSIESVHEDLEQLADADVSTSLGHVAASQAAARDFDSATETVIAGTSTSAGTRFQILRHHAMGGLGQVSVALDEELHREVALKEIQPRHAHHASSRERFLLEAEVTGGLEHPGIVPVFGLGQYPDGRPFYAMRFIRGESLKAAIEEFHNPDNPNQRQPGLRHQALRKLLGRFIDVCNAIEYAHSRGVLHRDLKPGNIMLGKYGETLVVDWGLAKALGRREVHSEEVTLRPVSALSSSGQTQPGSALGTPAYMSPEQAAGRLDELGSATDVYSLGATLYHLLTGKPPFQGRTDEVIGRVQKGDFRPPRNVAAGVDPALEDICLKAMSLKPQDRYASPRALADDVERWLGDERATASRNSLGARLTRIVRPHRIAVTVVAAWILIACLTSACVSVVTSQSESAAALIRKELSRVSDFQASVERRQRALESTLNALRNRDHAD